MPVGSVEQPPFAPPLFWSAVDRGCGWLYVPLVPALPVLLSAAAYAALIPAPEASTTELVAAITADRLNRRTTAFEGIADQPSFPVGRSRHLLPERPLATASPDGGPLGSTHPCLKPGIPRHACFTTTNSGQTQSTQHGTLRNTGCQVLSGFGKGLHPIGLSSRP